MSLIRTLWRCTFSPRLFKIYEVTWVGLVDVSTAHLFSVFHKNLHNVEVTTLLRMFITEIVRGEELGTMGRSSRDLRKYTAWQNESCDIVKSLSSFLLRCDIALHDLPNIWQTQSFVSFY